MGEDEKECNLNNIQNCSSKNVGMFECDNICFPLMRICDDHKDCVDGTDEKDCKTNKTRYYQVKLLVSNVKLTYFPNKRKLLPGNSNRYI